MTCANDNARHERRKLVNGKRVVWFRTEIQLKVNFAFIEYVCRGHVEDGLLSMSDSKCADKTGKKHQNPLRDATRTKFHVLSSSTLNKGRAVLLPSNRLDQPQIPNLFTTADCGPDGGAFNNSVLFKPHILQ